MLHRLLSWFRPRMSAAEVDRRLALPHRWRFVELNRLRHLSETGVRPLTPREIGMWSRDIMRRMDDDILLVAAGYIHDQA